MQIRKMNIGDYDLVLKLWKSIDGFYIRGINDTREGIEKFLKRNPNTNTVSIFNNEIIGSVLCGYDGRCAYFYHVCVKKEYRHKQIGKKMVQFSIESLKEEGATHINLIAFKNNTIGNLFWSELGWNLLDINMYELVIDEKNIRVPTH